MLNIPAIYISYELFSLGTIWTLRSMSWKQVSSRVGSRRMQSQPWVTSLPWLFKQPYSAHWPLAIYSSMRTVEWLPGKGVLVLLACFNSRTKLFFLGSLYTASPAWTMLFFHWSRPWHQKSWEQIFLRHSEWDLAIDYTVDSWAHVLRFTTSTRHHSIWCQLQTISCGCQRNRKKEVMQSCGLRIPIFQCSLML